MLQKLLAQGGAVMKILVACEESQSVTKELRKLGHEAYSCDILPCSGGHPEWHIMQDVIPLLGGRCSFKTMDGIEHSIEGKWDLIIAHPPCTYLTLAGNKWFKPEFADRFPNRQKQRKEAVDFFMTIANADCDRIAIENPVGIMSSQWRKPDQYIEPYMFGDAEKKKTGIWLKGLPLLIPTNVADPYMIHCKSVANAPRSNMETMNLQKKPTRRKR